MWRVSVYNCIQAEFNSAYQKTIHTVSTEPGQPSAQSKRSLLVCEHCGKSFRSRSGLQDHIKDKHLKVFKYSCEVCGKGFNRLWNYRGHLTCHHTELREKCNCGKLFQYKTSLQQHKRECTHGREGLPNCKQFHCRECGSTFKEKKTMKDHMRGAHGRKEYQCHVCGKLFRWCSSLSYHFKHFDHP